MIAVFGVILSAFKVILQLPCYINYLLTHLDISVFSSIQLTLTLSAASTSEVTALYKSIIITARC